MENYGWILKHSYLVKAADLHDGKDTIIIYVSIFFLHSIQLLFLCSIYKQSNNFFLFLFFSEKSEWEEVFFFRSIKLTEI